MKKTITILLFLIVNTFYAQQYRLDGITSGETYRQILTYDSNGSCISTVENFRDTADDNWDGTDGLYCTYDGNQITSLNYKEGQNYQNKTEFSYINNIIESGVLSVFDYINNQWIQSGTVTYTYNVDGKITEELQDTNEVILSNGDQVSYNGFIKYEHTYNSNIKVNWKKFKKNLNTNNEWQLERVKIYTYNSDNLLVLIEEGDNETELTSKTELTYDTNDNLTEEIYSYLDNSIWNYTSKYVYSYENQISEDDLLLPNHYILEYLLDSDFYTFKNKITNLSIYDWNNSWDFDMSLDFHYSEIALSVNDVLKDHLVIYPNPTSNKVKFEIENIENIEIYDINGKRMIDTKSNIINIENLSNGVYFYKIYKEKEILTGKLIKK